MKTSFISILRYMPSSLREEFVNIGLVLHSPEDQYISIKIVDSIKRITSFDDEVSGHVLKKVINNIASNFKSDENYNLFSFDELSDPNLLSKKTNRFVNTIRFSSIKKVSLDDAPLEEHLEKLFKIYVHFEVKKNERLSEHEILDNLKKYFSQKKLDFYTTKEKTLIKNSEVKFDISVPKNNLYIKSLDVSSSHGPKVIKEWMSNFQYTIDLNKNMNVEALIFLDSDNNKNTIFIKKFATTLKKNLENLEIHFIDNKSDINDVSEHVARKISNN